MQASVCREAAHGTGEIGEELGSGSWSKLVVPLEFAAGATDRNELIQRTKENE